MEIKIQIYGRIFSLCIGHETKWFEQVDLLTLIEEYYEKMKVVHADMIWSFWRSKVKKSIKGGN